MCCIAVTDTGAGMAPEVIAQAFDPFFTTKDVGKGTGLGLSQVYGFVKPVGRPRENLFGDRASGTTVKIYLPRLLSGSRMPDAGEPPAPSVTGVRRRNRPGRRGRGARARSLRRSR